jgi:DNA-binding XRE family transcriptional regulator
VRTRDGGAYREGMGEIITFPRRAQQTANEREHEVPPAVDPLWREAVGDVLRGVRQEHGDRLADVAERAGVSVQYLSEVERGRKEPSSEMIAAIAGAQGLTLLDLTLAVAGRLGTQQSAGAVLQASWALAA